MTRKGQWTLLSARLVLNDLQLRLSPLVVVPRWDCRPRKISDYLFLGVNHETVPISSEEYMQYRWAFSRILRNLKSANPHLGPVSLSKIYIVIVFYLAWVRASNVPTLGVLFPSANGEEYLLGFPLPPPSGLDALPQDFYHRHQKRWPTWLMPS
jgi:hypothetical protein